MVEIDDYVYINETIEKNTATDLRVYNIYKLPFIPPIVQDLEYDVEAFSVKILERFAQDSQIDFTTEVIL